MATRQAERKKDLAHQKRVEAKLDEVLALLHSLALEDRIKPKKEASGAKTTRSSKK